MAQRPHSHSSIRLTQPVISVDITPMAAGAANGWLVGALVLGSFLGGLLSGFLADALGFNSVNWMGGIGAGLAILILPAGRGRFGELLGIQDNGKGK